LRNKLLLASAILCAVICFILFFPSRAVCATLVYDGAPHEYDGPDITLVVNGSEVTNLPVSPIILNDRVYVPAKEMFESLGATVSWDADNYTVYIGYGEKLIAFQIESLFLNINGVISDIPVPAKIINDKTMIPLRFASESLGFTVDWNPDSKTVNISEPAAPAPAITAQNSQTGEPVKTSAVTAGDAANNTLNNISNNADNAADSPAIQNGDYNPYTREQAVDVSPDITVMDYPEASVLSLGLPGPGSNDYVITAGSPISKVVKFLLSDNRLVIDIYNANLSFDVYNYDVSNSFLSSVRCSQFQVTPEKIVRFVFDLIKPVDYGVSLSADRTAITVSFITNTVSGFNFISAADNDILIINGDYTPAMMIFPLTSPDRLVIDLPLCRLAPDIQSVSGAGFISTGIRFSQFDADTVRIVIDLKEQGSYDWTAYNGQALIRLKEASYRNIDFSSEHMALTISKSAGMSLDISQIVQDDLYNELTYVITLPGDYSQYIGSGDKLVKDQYIDSINIQTADGKTRITIYENQILAYEISEDADNIYIYAMSPKEKYSEIVVLDPGHGGDAPGASAYDGSYIEKDLTLDVAQRLISLLEADPNIKVYSTRTSDVNPSFEDRVALGNDYGDLFISMHYNSFTTDAATGLETYYSDNLIPSNYNYSSEQVADIIQKNLLADLGLTDRKTHDWDFYVTTYTTIPSALVEMGFLSNPGDMAKIKTPEFRQATAESIYKSILEIFSTYKPPR